MQFESTQPVSGLGFRLAADEFCSKHLSRLLMQGLLRVLPAAWNHARALMPAQSKPQGPSMLPMAAVRCGLGEGAESGAGPLDHRASYVGAERTANQNERLAVAADHVARNGCWPRSLSFIWPRELISPGGCRQLDGPADPPPPNQVALRRKRS